MIHTQSQAGFSLVETLVAITILLIVIVGPMSIAATAARGTNLSSEQVVASFLAQEGAELAQMARDHLLLPRFLSGASGNGWDDFTNTGGAYAACFQGGGCGLTVDGNDAGTITVTNCSTPGNCRLYHQNTAGQRAKYSHDSDQTETIYTRTIRLRPQTAGRDVEIISQVTWQLENSPRQEMSEVRTYVYNVYGR